MEDISFLRLKKNCKKDTNGMPVKKAAILGNIATQHIATAIKGYAYEKNIALDIFDADYNQIEPQIIDNESELYVFSPDYVMIFMAVEKLAEDFYNTSDKASFADNMYLKIKNYWDILSQRMNVNIIQTLFIEKNDMVYGNYSTRVSESLYFQIKKLNYLLMSDNSHKNVYFADINNIQSTYGLDKVYDDKLYYIAKMPFSMDILPVVAKCIVDIIRSLMGSIKKCVILDLDNTLWGGVIGDDGMEGIQIGELGTGHAFSDFQLWLKQLKERGIILAVCSKNNEDIAKEPFISHPEMILKLEDIAMFVANWQDKASNIRYIQETINIGMDSIVFIDDNPFEREQVKSMINDITVPDMPKDPALYLSYLKSLNLFETTSYSAADRERTGQYQAEIGRSRLMTDFSSYDDYLKGLEMVACAKPFDAFHYARIAQLTQRSNQFNLRTIRYTEEDIKNIAENDKYLTLYYTLKDKFGDYGLISVVIMEKKEDKSLFIDTWLMSCRVLKRGMEEFIINKVVALANENGYNKIYGQYIKTQKNAMVEKIYEKLGFTEVSENVYCAEVTDFSYNKCFIIEDI